MKVATLALAAAAAVLAPHAPQGGVQAREMAAGSVTGLVSSYIISTPDIGSCRLKGIAAESDNFKHYASVSGRDATLTDGCARCIKATRNDDASKSVTAYVLDVAQGAGAGTLKLSPTALQALAVDVNANNVSVSYRFVSCPATFASGNVKACLMEGASNAYIPLQFYNAQKVIASVKINGVAATTTKESYLFSATSGQSKEGTSSWFANVAVEMTSSDNETLAGTFAFGAPSGCATYTSQFSAASTADGANIAGNGGDSDSSSALVPALIGGVGALFLLIGSVFFVRRRRLARAGAASDTPNPMNDDVEGQYLEPKAKPQPSPTGPTYASDHSGGMDPEPRSPTIDYEQSYSPAAAAFSMAASTLAPPPPAASPVEDRRVSSFSGSGSGSGSNSTYSYSKPMTQSFSSNLSSSPRASSKAAASTAPTFQAPVVPTYSNASRQASYEQPRSQSFSDEEEQAARSSFDIDDMRNTEEMKTSELGDARFSTYGAGGRSTQTYAAAPTYADSVVTSPQSYVRATSLRRNTATRTPSAYRPDAYDGGTGYGQDRQNSGYSRDSLNILGYPYAKKSGRNGSVTGP
ncbi:hypothetical protein PybrP1_005428 [[Pythium] brassicae (nom. inval.)]|nr:hypothetical protein PybrP1_005428 [[Pythium] brassicae (nom. inval.)]